MVRTLQEGEVLPHPAEDLSADDDLLSWILVDQLGCLPNTKLGVHPQQVKFVGPVFKTSEILAIVQEVNLNAAREGANCRLLLIRIYLKLLGDC
jgi:histone-lysine N-methyltransferase SUV420H